MNKIREDEVDDCLRRESVDSAAENELKRRYPNPSHRAGMRAIARFNGVSITEFLETDYHLASV